MSTDDASTATTDRRLSERIGSIAPSATLAVDATAKALKAQGRPVIGFGAGEPDFPTPQHVLEAVHAAVDDPANHRYSPAAGLPELRAAVAAQAGAMDHATFEPSQVVITNGGKQAVYEVFAALLNPGDEVILPAPYWTTYPEAIRLAGGREVEVLAGVDQDYLPTVEQLEAARTERTTTLLLCSPSNPTGSVMSRELLAEIGAWAHEHGLWIVTDEIYQHLVYGDASFVSILEAAPQVAGRTIVLGGVAKTFAMTGWRVGWAIGPADVIKAVTTLQSHLSSNVCNIAQRAALAAVDGPMEPIHAMREAFDRRRRTILEMLSRVPGFTVPTPQGAFYAFPDVSGVLGREIRGRRIDTSADLATVILEEAEVAAVPGEAFGAPGHLRFSYALGDDDLAEGIERVIALLSE